MDKLVKSLLGRLDGTGSLVTLGLLVAIVVLHLTGAESWMLVALLGALAGQELPSPVKPSDKPKTGGTSALTLVLALVVGSTAVGCARDAQGVRVDSYDRNLAAAAATIDMGYMVTIGACDWAAGRAESDERLARVKERCAKAFTSFEVMRVKHNMAADHLESVGDGSDPKYLELAGRVFAAAGEVWGLVADLRADLGAP